MIAPVTLVAASICRVGAPVRLSASSDRDPRVLLWSSRDGLTYYEAGEWASTVSVMGDTVVLASGTAAIITQCDDAHGFVGVKVTIGTHRGHYGWVRATDIAS